MAEIEWLCTTAGKVMMLVETSGWKPDRLGTEPCFLSLVFFFSTSYQFKMPQTKNMMEKKGEM